MYAVLIGHPQNFLMEVGMYLKIDKCNYTKKKHDKCVYISIKALSLISYAIIENASWN